MERRDKFGSTLDTTLLGLSIVNAFFAAIGFASFGDATKDIVTNNIGAGGGLTAIKSMVCGDLLLTYPLVFVAGREILEKLVIQKEERGEMEIFEEKARDDEGLFVGLKQQGVRVGMVALTFVIAHTNSELRIPPSSRYCKCCCRARHACILRP